MSRALLLFLASSAAAAVACTAASSDSASSNASVTSEVAGVHFYEQAPVDGKLGQAISLTQNDAGQLTAASLSEESCVAGTPKTARDEARAAGQADVLTAVVASFGDAKVLGSNFGFPVSESAIAGPFGIPVLLDDVLQFHDAVFPSATRVAGAAEIRVSRNAFHLDADEHLTKADPSCGVIFVDGMTAMRFVGFGFSVDFANPTDRNDYVTKFPAAENAIFTPTPELKAFLAERHGQLSVHVLTSVGLKPLLEPKLAGMTCNATALEGCTAMKDALFDFAKSVETVPGGDDTLDGVRAQGTTWGTYELWMKFYRDVPQPTTPAPATPAPELPRRTQR